jgi:hypothetical protein
VTLTIDPLPRSRICGSTACRQRTAPQRFTFMTSRYSDGEASSATPLPPMPALFTSVSTRPASSRIRAKPSRTESSSAMSSSTKWISTPACSAIASSLSSRADARTVP